MKRSGAIVLAMLLGPGCASDDPKQLAPIFEPTPAVAGRGAGGELLAYLGRVRTLNEKALAAETQRQREAARAQGADLEAVKLALALSLAPASDDGEIAALMEPISRRAGADDNVKTVASFLLLQAAERRRLKEGATAAGGRLRDERRAVEAQKQRADALEQRATQLQERATALQQKIDALTELEKSLSDRQVQNR